MLRAPNAGAWLRCQAKFRRNSKWWESIREKEGKRAPAECLCLHFCSCHRHATGFGITHSCRQCQESGVEKYQDQDAPRICQLLRIPIFFYFIILTQWSAIRKTLRKAIFLKPNNFEKIWRHTTDMSVSGGVPRAEEFLEMMPFGIFV